jgi:hypothetical protein
MKNKKNFLLSFGLILLFAAILLFTRSASAGSSGQATYNTPTPNANGQIIYTVQEGENCTIIFIKTNVTIDQLIALNDLGVDCNIFPGQELILGTGQPATATLEGPQQTPTPGAPTPTPLEGTGEVCVVLFEDLDGNQMRSENEGYLAGGVISISNRTDTYSETKETVVDDPLTTDTVERTCFEDVPEGDYNLSLGIPDGYIATTSLNFALTVSPGDTIVIDFGAQPSSQANIGDSDEVIGNRSPLLLAIGLFFLAGGAGLAFFFIRSRQNA